MTIQQVTLRSQLLHRVALPKPFNRIAFLGNVWKLFPQPNVYLWVSVPDRFRPGIPLFKYHGETIFFRFANEEDLDTDNEDFQVSEFEGKRFGETFETQLRGVIRGFFAGSNFLIDPGVLTEVHSPTSFIVSTSGLEAIVDDVAIGSLVNEQGWSGLDPVPTNYLWACTIEESDVQGSFQSSRMKSQWDPLSTITATPPAARECALVATWLSGTGIDDSPPGQTTVFTPLSQHQFDNTDPHGAKLFQELLQVNDLQMLSPVLLDQFFPNTGILDVLKRGRYGQRVLPAGTVLGDLNEDGVFNQADVNLLSDILNLVTPAPADTSQAFINGDVNADGRLDAVDLQYMLDKLAGRIDVFPADEIGTRTQHVTVSGLMNAIGKFIFHGDLVLSGSNFTDQDALLGAIDNIKNVTVGALTINSGLDITTASTFHEDISVLSGVLWDGLSISGHGATLDAHIADVTSNPHDLNSGQVPDLITELGGVLSGDLTVLSGVAIAGVDWTQLVQFLDGSEIQVVTHLHDTTSGLQFLGFAPQSTAFDTVFGDPATVTYEHRSNENVGVLSGTDSVVVAHIRKFLPEAMGTPISVKYTHGVESDLSGLDLLFGGSFGEPDLDNTVADMIMAANFDELGSDLGDGLRSNAIIDGRPTEWREHQSLVPAVPAVISNGADFEVSLSPDAALRPQGGDFEPTRGASIVSLSFWLRPESTISTQVLMSEASSFGPNTPRFAVNLSAANALTINLRRTSGSILLSTGGGDVTDGVDNHVVIIIDLLLDEYEIYVDDSLVGSGSIGGSGALDNGTPLVADSVGWWWGARASAFTGGSPVLGTDGVLDMGYMWAGLRLNSTHVSRLFNSGSGRAFNAKPPGTITMQVKDSDGNIINPVETRFLRETALTETTVDLAEGNYKGDTFFEAQFVLSGGVDDKLFFGPWSMLFAPSNLPLEREIPGIGIGTDGG